jgi:hypothetical protein
MLAAAAMAGCSGVSEGPLASASFDPVPAASVTSESHAYRIEVYNAGSPTPVRGENRMLFVITSALSGAPAVGLDLDVVPWMPVMGHGTSTRPVVEAGDAPGRYVVAEVNLFMPGLWELRTTITGQGTTDHAAPQFDIP